MFRTNLAAWCLAAAWLVSANLVSGVVRAQPVDAGQITAGVGEISAPGTPGTICVFGPTAASVVAGKGDGKTVVPVVAAASWGKGRIAAFGHTGYLDPGNLDRLDTARLFTQALRWAAGADPSGRAGGVDVAVIDNPDLATWLKSRGFDAKSIKVGDLNDRELKPFKAVVMSQGAMTDGQLAALREFCRDEGNGLIVAATGWGWLQLNSGKTLEQHPGNRLIGAAGLWFTDGTAGRTGKDGLKTGGARAELLNASTALDLLERASAAGAAPVNADDLAQASATATVAARSIPQGDALFMPRVRALAQGRGAGLSPSKAKPLTQKKHPLERFLLAYQVRQTEGLAPEAVRAHPAAADFPGAVATGAPRVEREVEIDLSVPGWHSTGLYAPAGEVVTVHGGGAGGGGGGGGAGGALRVQIGCHTDRLWHKESWDRVPDVVVSRALAGDSTRIASAFGGLVYIVVDRAQPGQTRRLRVSGVVESPRFVLGRTTAEQWAAQRRLPGPWAELQTRKVILTVPAEAVRGLDDAEALMRWWDSVLDAHATLATISPDRARPERIVADVQISAGYMHSGYPIMTHLDAAAHMTALDDLKQGKSAWGLFHELGHNHQQGDWTFEGTTEVTCNLFTLHALETVCAVPAGQRGHPGVNQRPKMLDQYLARPDFEKWKSDPFLALHMYVQVRDAFGWEPFKQVFAEYRGLTRQKRPASDQEKRDQWMVRLSRAVGRDLGPFFEAWGVPTTEAARASIRDLPAWMPPAGS
ncbi:MAG: M60 family metallopeptidase [Phycisphaeraceae bacterium]|nr:M60 family metallopeptidase [Phycisphaeraceae bacterium]